MNDVTSAKILFVEDEEAVLSSMKKFLISKVFLPSVHEVLKKHLH